MSFYAYLVCIQLPIKKQPLILFFDVIEIFILSLIQGITEFLPVSSSSHLVLVSKYLNFENLKRARCWPRITCLEHRINALQVTLSNHPLQDACEALEWDCRLKSCRGQVCDNNWPFFGSRRPCRPQRYTQRNGISQRIKRSQGYPSLKSG